MSKSIAQQCLEADDSLNMARRFSGFKGHPQPDVLRFHFEDNSCLDFQMTYTPIAAGRIFEDGRSGEHSMKTKTELLELVDRVTAERDALAQNLRFAEEGYVSFAEECDKLQQRLTAADERVDVLEGLLLLWMSPVQRTMAGRCRLVERTDAALKPAEGQRNQCDGCRAGIPIVNGAHRMGKADGYPDTMSCTAKLYKP